MLLVASNERHLGFFTALNSDVEVMRHITGQPRSRSETELEWSRRLAHRTDADRGLGYWTGYVNGQPVGWWGLGFSDSDPQSGELGFRLLAGHWRQGLGSEGARLLLCHGFTNSRVDRVWAGTRTANLASRATLAALGLECTAEPFPGVLTYEITHDQWAARAAGNS